MPFASNIDYQNTRLCVVELPWYKQCEQTDIFRKILVISRHPHHSPFLIVRSVVIIHPPSKHFQTWLLLSFEFASRDWHWREQYFIKKWCKWNIRKILLRRTKKSVEPQSHLNIMASAIYHFCRLNGIET